MKSSPPNLLCVAGFDPTGGAGLQADVETAAALGVRAVCAQTCNTVQDGVRTITVTPTPPETLALQLARLIADFDVAAVKVGLIASADNAEVVAEAAAALHVPFVVDPVLRDGAGEPLCTDGTAQALRARLLPHATCATPNLEELTALVPEASTPAAAAQALLDEGCAAVLVTGEEKQEQTLHHALYQALGRPERRVFSAARLTGEFHGSGCTLSCALAAQLALGATLDDAVPLALEFTARALERADAPSRSRARKFPKRLCPVAL